MILSIALIFAIDPFLPYLFLAIALYFAKKDPVFQQNCLPFSINLLCLCEFKQRLKEGEISKVRREKGHRSDQNQSRLLLCMAITTMI